MRRTWLLGIGVGEALDEQRDGCHLKEKYYGMKEWLKEADLAGAATETNCSRNG